VDNWKPAVISEKLHVVHNFCQFGNTRMLLTASNEGVHFIGNTYGSWQTVKLLNERVIDLEKVGGRKSSEVAKSTLQVVEPEIKAITVVATVEPWHGNQVVLYYTNNVREWDRVVLDKQLRWGHAINFAPLTEARGCELVVGVRDNPDPKQGDTFTEKRGVRIYRNTDGKGAKWDRYILEDGGVAVEDLTVADLNGDGKPDIVAVGRQTGNCRIYWNQGK
jgi:FG-GAP-like repeat